MKALGAGVNNMSEHDQKQVDAMSAGGAESDYAEQRRKLVRKMAAGAFGAPVVLSSLATKAAAASVIP